MFVSCYEVVVYEFQFAVEFQKGCDACVFSLLKKDWNGCVFESAESSI